MLPIKTASALLLALGLAGCVDSGNPLGTEHADTRKAGIASRPIAEKNSTHTLITTANTNPAASTQARLHIPARGFVNEYLPLDGSASTGSMLTYHWSVDISTAPDPVTLPAFELSDSTYPRALLLARQPGTYPVKLTVTDRLGQVSEVSARTHVLGLPQSLGFQVLDAEYSSSLDSMILVSAQPDYALYILTPGKDEIHKIPLAAAPTTVAVSPDGLFAVVGHEAALSRIDLANAQVAGPLVNVNFEVFDAALAQDGMAYASLPDYVQWDTLYEINLNTGVAQPAITDSLLFSGGSHLQYQAQGKAIYTIDANLLPIDLNRFDATTSPARWQRESPYAGEYDMGGRPSPSNLWLSEDGQSLLTSGGSLFQASGQSAADMKYLRSLADQPAQAGLTGLIHANHSSEAARFAVLSLETLRGTADDTSAYFLKVYTTPGLEPEDIIPLLGLDFDHTGGPVTPQFVFFNSAGTARYVLLSQSNRSYWLAF